MLNKMQKNKTIARGFVKIPREVLSEFWNALTEELNSAGPPNKNVSEWKKVIICYYYNLANIALNISIKFFN